MKLTLKETKTIMFEKGSVDITDPCYKKDVWCRFNNLNIKKGEYICRNYVKNERTFMMEIMNKEFFEQLNPNEDIDEKYINIGPIEVDAGMCGIFEDKPDYTQEEWNEWCALDPNKVPQHGMMLVNSDVYKCVGVCCCSGYGDGEYYVYTIEDSNGECVAVKIEF